MDRAVKFVIASACNSKDPNRFPGPQPVSIERRHFHMLKSDMYLVCEKNDGTRCFVVSFTFENVRKVVVVDRAFNMRVIGANIPVGTILDGEYMDNEIIIHDAIQIKGEDVRHLNLLERLDRANKICKGILRTPKSPTIKVKNMVPLKNISEIQLGEKTDGLIFTPVHEPYGYGTHESMFKWKPRKDITIDFLVIEDKKTCVLVLQSETYITTLTKATALGRDPEEFLGQIVECEYGQFGWSIVRTRPDKTFPNNQRTYDRTIVNIREDIQLKEFLNL
jgi:mRNA capping enzyme, catalytic domain/mRNA capping enzyme, C-terminal domain